MMSARMSTLARLRTDIDRLQGDADGTLSRTALGHAGADAVLQGGLVHGAVHEVFAQGCQSAAATGFVVGLARRVAVRRPLLWVRQDFSALENGALSMHGWRELGLDPRRVVMVYAHDVETALQVTADALACDALGAVVMEIWGETRQFDLVASRKLTLAAREAGVTGLVLRLAAAPSPSTAETRWIVHAARSPPVAPWQAWGAPVFDARLARNRHGPTGHWIMEWNCDECLFRDALFGDAAAHPQPVAAAPADRSHQAGEIAQWRRTG
ncbi:MAG: DNA repair protein [Rhizobiales bacterium 62-47]|jgi:protein ImuA|nr:DNA repair protein [Hyphomicrobiales bacterium]OJY08492.1 MAG: DNA repair protein [Rhizobiales bacterium 62-47]